MSPRKKVSKAHDGNAEDTFFLKFRQALQSVGNLEELEKAALAAVRGMFGGDHGVLYDFENTSGGLKEIAMFGEIEKMLSQDMRIFAQYAIDHPLDPESVLIAPDVSKVKKLSARKSIRRGMTAEVLIIPLVAGDQARGVIYLGSRTKGTIHFKNITLDRVRVLGGIIGELIGIHHVLEQLKLQNRSFTDELKQKADTDDLLGTSDAIQRVRSALELVSPTDIPVTLIGERGTGKRHIASLIHKKSTRAQKQFMVMDAAEIPASMAAEILFGKSEVNRSRRKRGLLEKMKGGTLCIANIENLALPLQKSIVDAMETGKAKTTVGNKEITVDLRFIFTTVGDPKKLFERKRLHKSMLMKMSLFPILVPALRDRVEDLPMLVTSFAENTAATFGKSISGIDTEVYDYLGTWDWNENLAELEKEIRYAVLRTPNKHGVLNASSLSPRIIGKQKPVITDPDEGTLKQRVARIEKRMIIESLEKNRHNQSITADELGLSRQALINKIQRYGIETGRKYKRKLRELRKQANSAAR